MITRQDVLKTMVYEINRICREENIEYTILGKVAKALYETGDFPENMLRVSVAMTFEGIKKFTAAVEKENSHYGVEEALRNKKKQRFTIRFYDKNTTCVNINDYKKFKNHGIYITLVEIEKAASDKLNQSLEKKLQFYDEAYKKLKKKSRRKLLGKFARKRFISLCGGKKKYLDKIHKMKIKETAIASFEEIKNQETILLGNRFVEAEAFAKNTAVAVTMEQGTVNLPITLGLMDKEYVATPGDEFILRDEVVVAGIPFTTYATAEFWKKIDAMAHEKAVYDKKRGVADKAGKTITKGWNTYLMSRDVVDLEIRSDKLLAVAKTGKASSGDTSFREAVLQWLADYDEKKTTWEAKDIPWAFSEEIYS